MRFRSTNPALNPQYFQGVTATERMTLDGTINKTLVLLGLVSISALGTYTMSMENPGLAMLLGLGGAIGGFIMALIIMFARPNNPQVLIGMYALLEGLFLGSFSFMVENNISFIFQKLHEYQLKVNLIQNSAISFSVCVYDKFNRLKELLSILKATFKVECLENVNLFTIRHFDEKSSNEILKNNELILEQRTDDVLQLIVR